MDMLRILHVEDSERDAELIRRELEVGGITPEILRVDTAETVAAALSGQTWDVVLVDCTMPRFDCFQAVEVLKRNEEDIPLILVSGTVGEESAVALMKAGVADYVMKSNLSRLVPAIQREVAEAGHRRARRLAEQRLWERERMLSTAQRIAHLGSWERNYQTKTLWWSEELYAILGREPDYRPSSSGSYADVAHPDDRRRVEEALDAALRLEEAPGLEHRIVRPDGSVRWVYTRLEPEFEDDGRPKRLIGTVLDITERKQAEEALRESEAQYRTLMEQAADGIVVADATLEIVTVNSRACEMFGYSESEFLGKGLLDFFHPGDEQTNPPKLGEIRSGEIVVSERRLRRKDGTYFPTETSTKQLEDGRVQVIIRDISERMHAEAALRESEATYRALMEQAADGILVLDSAWKTINVNSRACEMFGYTVDEFIGLGPFDLLHSDEQLIEDHPDSLSALHRGVTVTNERLLRRKGGSIFPGESSVRQLDDGSIQVIIRDITERKSAEDALRRSEREYRNLFESANDAIILFNADSEEILDVNIRATEMYGVGRDDLIGQDLGSLIDESSMDNLLRSVAGDGTGVEGVEAVGKRAGGGVMHLLINASVVEFRGQQIILSIHRDITVQKELERQLSHQALHDTLTGLANRALFRDRLDHALTRARVDDEDLAVLLLDLDRFKLINEGLGHDVGDRLLVAVSERLQEGARAEDTVARLGGDEFSILLEGVTNLREVTLVAERISNLLTMPLTLDGHDIVVTSSIGIVLSPRGRGTADELLRNADIAMYRAKDEGRAGYVVFDPSMNATMLERLKLETDLRHAIERDELRVYYQPTVSFSTGKVTGMEALVRWMHPGQGLLPPSAFIPLAEEAGLIRPLGQWVLARACHQLQVWQAGRSAAEMIVLNVNLSAQEFQHPDLIRGVSDVLEASGLDPEYLQLEITENVAMNDAAATHSRLRQLKALGVQVAIDDFGTGYSSLSYLKRFPVDTLKIDKSFVDGLGSDPEDTAIVQAVVSLGSALGLNIIAEGVETETAVNLLQEIGCSIGQGYHYSEPLPAEAFEDLWANDSLIHSNWRSRRAS